MAPRCVRVATEQCVLDRVSVLGAVEHRLSKQKAIVRISTSDFDQASAHGAWYGGGVTVQMRLGPSDPPCPFCSRSAPPSRETVSWAGSSGHARRTAVTVSGPATCCAPTDDEYRTARLTLSREQKCETLPDLSPTDPTTVTT